MFASFTARRSAFAIAIVAASLAIPALAYAATFPATTRADLAGSAGYCQSYDTNTVTSPPVGNVQITTSPATSPGFHAVRVGIKVRPGQVPAGTYPVWLVNLYRDDSGQVIGCAASALSSEMTVKTGGVNYHGFADRYSGQYELKVYVGPIWGPGYASSPSLVDVP